MELQSTVDCEMTHAIEHRLNALSDGFAEFCTSNIFLVRHTYNFSIVWNRPLEIYGVTNNKRFVTFPEDIPTAKRLKEILPHIDFIRAIPERLIEHPSLKEHALDCEEDIDNHEYIYRREDLAELSGRKYHKKRNLIAQFKDRREYIVKPINEDTRTDALDILNTWHKLSDNDADYIPAKEAILYQHMLKLEGWILYLKTTPVAYTLGETIPNTNTWAMHYEKALISYKGAFQVIDMETAKHLPATIEYINKEQDLGKPGLRQAKESYRPVSFVKKFTCAIKNEK